MTPQRWQQVKDTLAAALELETAARSEYLAATCRNDTALRREVESLLEQPADDFNEVADAGSLGDLFELNNAGRRIGAYELIRELGRGGMGTVWLARRADKNFEKQVAVKLLKRGTDTDEVLRRFRDERQILARLEHPNIARLLDAGTTDDGLPYFVIEYVEGMPITRYTHEHNFSIAERLRLFRSVCSAVSYAHQNLIVHRDLKPANVLVTKGGEVKLLDFGIAKILQDVESEQAHVTLTLHRRMTPEYASPEQVSGETITTASDVYSLGVLLYELLTGKRPYRLKSRAADEITKAIREQQPEKPSTAVTRSAGISKSEIRNSKLLKGDLDNILLKALSKEPQRRYRSADHFSDDIRRHLEGLPVRARKDSAWYRSSKFIRRHKVGAAAAALVVLLLFASVGAIAFEAQRANRRFNQVRQLAHSVLFDYHDAIAALPGSTAVRARLVKDALQYLDNLSREAGRDFGLQRELGAAYERVAEIQGNSYHANLGDTAGSLKSYEKSLSIRQHLVAQHPNDRALRNELANSWDGVADVQYDVANLSQALRSYEEAEKIRQSLAAAEPHNVPYEMALAELYMKMADLKGMDGYPNLGDTAGALATCRKAVAIIEPMAAAQPDDRKLQSRFANISTHLGALEDATGDFATALATEQRAVAIFQALVARYPDNEDYRFELLVADSFLRAVLVDNGKLTESVALSREVLQKLQDTLNSDPKNSSARRGLGVTYNSIGRDLLLLGDAAGALENHRKALEIAQSLSSAAPDSNSFKADVAFTLQRIGEADAATGNYKAAMTAYDQALKIEEPRLSADPSNFRVRDDVGSLYIDTARASGENGDATQTATMIEKGLALSEAVAAHSPSNVKAQAELARRYFESGKAEIALAKKEADEPRTLAEWRHAEDLLRKSAAVWQRMTEHGQLAPLHGGKPAEVAAALVECQGHIR